MYKNFTVLRHKTLLGIVLFTMTASTGVPLFAAQDPLKSSALAAVSVSGQELTQDISLGIMRVPEFQFLQQEAQRMGVKVYLFGGTASSFAHYVRWDIMRSKGDTRLLEDRFGYDMVDIFRNNQDFDIVVDGNADQVQRLQQTLDQKFPHMQGAKSAWEVRSLRHAIGTKAALLGNHDFLNQHTDSNSTGMIDLTLGSTDVIKDLRDWNNPQSQFDRDLLEGKIHFYFSNNHDSTEMARQGNNPAIVSVVRLLVKALQFDLELRAEDLPAIQKIINDFNPSNIRSNSYLQRRLTDTALKLVQNSVNVERSITLLDQLGLRKKLIDVANNQGATETALLLNKEPLRTKALGEGPGKTAQELGLSVVSHDTRTLEAYYSILRSPTGEPNVFISRDGVNGEAAYYGNGFYVKSGKTGAVDGGLTVRFKLNPNARQGTDFNYVFNEGYIVILNKKALQVIPDLAKMSLKEMASLYIRNQFDAKERAVKDKILKKITSQMHSDTQAEIEGLRTLLLSTQSLTPQVEEIAKACAANPKCSDERIQKLLADGATAIEKRKAAVDELKYLKNFRDRPDLASKFVLALQHPSGNNPPMLSNTVDFIALNKRDSQIAVINELAKINVDYLAAALRRTNYMNFPEIAEAVGSLKDLILIREYAKSNSPASQVVVMNKLLQKNGSNAAATVMHILGSTDLNNRPELVPVIIETNKMTRLSFAELEIISSYFLKNSAADQAKIADAMADKNPRYAAIMMAKVDLKNRADLVPAMVTVIKATSFDNAEMNPIVALVNGTPPDSQVKLAEAVLAKGPYYANQLIARINPVLDPKFVPTVVAIIKASQMNGNDMETFIKIAKANPPSVAIAIGQTFIYRNSSYFFQYLNAIDLTDKADLLPVLLKAIKGSYFKSDEMAVIEKFTKMNPGADIELKIATEFANKSPEFGHLYLSRLNLKNRPDLLPIILKIANDPSYKNSEMETLIAFGKSNTLGDAQQIEAAIRKYSNQNADVFRNNVGGALAATAPSAQPQVSVVKSPPVAGGLRVLPDITLELKVNMEMRSHDPRARAWAADFLGKYDAAVDLIDMLQYEIRRDANPDVFTSIFKALQNNGTNKHLIKMDQLHKDFMTATVDGLMNQFKSLVGSSKENELESLWQQTRAQMSVNNVIGQKEYQSSLLNAAKPVNSVAPICTKIFGS
jgi:hypothetical protein